MYLAFNAINYVEDIPNNFKEIEHRVDCRKWKAAIDKELKSIEEYDTWELINIPDSKEILDSKWVFAYKPFEKIENERYKARLVVRGFAQKKVFDYGETYSPVAKLATIRLLFAVGNEIGFIFEQMDVKTAFLNGKINSKIYLYLPEGKDVEFGKVYKLKKALYGLKESAKSWKEEFHSYITCEGFKQSDNDFCLYIKKENKFIYVLLYVDEVIIASKCSKLIENVKRNLKVIFAMKEKDKVEQFLGFRITYDIEKGILQLDQEIYIQKLLRKFNVENCKGSLNPIEPKLEISEVNEISNVPMRELVGCLMYLACCTRPDISYAVNYFSQYQDKPTQEIFNYLKRVLRYLKMTSSYRLIYVRGGDFKLNGFCDADWGSNKDRKSISEFCFKFSNNLISWMVKKKHCVGLSTAEAELISLTSCICEGIWLRKLLLDFDINCEITLFEDNQACIKLIKNPDNNKRVKHVDIKLKFVHDNIENNIKIEYIDTKNQIADIFTKGLPVKKFEKIIDALDLKAKY